MGIYDRDYYRNEGPSVLDSLMPSGIVCRWLIAINVIIFILQYFAQQTVRANGDGIAATSAGWVTDWFVLDTAKVAHGEIWRLLTYAFLHSTSDIYHILFNMLFLWWFGSDVEQVYGRREFLAIYLVSAFLGGATFEIWSLMWGAPAYCLGASGAVTTLLVLCACHFPGRIIYLFMILPVPIWFFVIVEVGRDVFALISNAHSGVAVQVHLAGAAFAFAYYKMQFRLLNLFHFNWLTQVRSRPRLKIFDPIPEKAEPIAVSPSNSASAMDEHLEAKSDAILEKIDRTGMESLTHQEKEILRKAAEMYKRRRT